MNPAAVSSIAAAISATFAGLTSAAAWTTVRGRRPKLTIAVMVGNPSGGGLDPNDEGSEIAVRVTNTRDVDLEALDLWFETPAPRSIRRRRNRPAPPRVWPPVEWFDPGAGLIPGTVRARHTELYAFKTDELGVALAAAGFGRYRPVLECAGPHVFRGGWIEVAVTSDEKA